MANTGPVVPGPAPLKLPAELRRVGLGDHDWGFEAILAVLFLVFFSVVAVAKQAPLPSAAGEDDIPVTIARVIMPDRHRQAPRPEPSSPVLAKPAQTRKQKQARHPDLDRGEPNQGRASRQVAESRARALLESNVGRRGLVGLLGKRGRSNPGLGEAVADVFDEGTLARSDGQAFSGIDGLDLAMAPGRLQPRGPGGGDPATEAVELKDLGTEGVLGGGGLTSKRKREVQVVGRLSPASLEEFESVSRSPEDIKRVVRRRLGTIQRCYERRLKRDPDLRGKVVVRFVIHPGGRVVAVEVVGNSTGDRGLADCIAERLGQVRFDQVDGGETVVTYPFLLDANR
jgi:outer membrane biosynthesis protein TonB